MVARKGDRVRSSEELRRPTAARWHPRNRPPSARMPSSAAPGSAPAKSGRSPCRGP
ncbi:unnamed protein product [Ascophyllum nodosum]